MPQHRDPSDPPAPRKWTFKKGVRHFKVLDILSPDDRAAYLRYVRDPSSTVDSCLAWLLGRGYSIGRCAVYRHRRHLSKETAEVRRAAEFAHEFVQLSRAAGEDGTGKPTLGGAFVEATQTAFEQYLMEGVLEMNRQGKELSPRQWVELGKAVAAAVSARRQVESMRDEFHDRAAKAEDARRPLKRIDGVALSDKVRRILGMPLPGEPIPELPPPAGTAEESPAPPGTPGEAIGIGHCPRAGGGEGFLSDESENDESTTNDPMTNKTRPLSS